jgi:hypothetical protein
VTDLQALFLMVFEVLSEIYGFARGFNAAGIPAHV